MIFSGFLSLGEIKYKYTNPLNTNMLLEPDKNVAERPFPKIGNKLLKSKFLVFPINIKMIVIKIKGNKSDVLLNMLLLFIFEIIPLEIVSSEIINIICVNG